eukprot:scaffold7963_cov93-Skeletonema_marinoi.AAC.1
MKFPVIVGAVLVAGSGVAVAFTSRNSAAIRSSSTAFANNFSSRASTRSTTAAYATPMEFAKAEIASNDVAAARSGKLAEMLES